MNAAPRFMQDQRNRGGTDLMAYGRAVFALGLIALLSIAVFAMPVPAAPSTTDGSGASTNAGATRYLDPIFAGALAPKVEASYDPSVPLNREQLLTVRAVAGSFTLTVSGATTAPLAFDAPASDVEVALQALPTVNVDGVAGNDVTVTGGVGGPFGGFHYHVLLNDTPPPGTTLPKVVANDVSLSSPIGHSAVTQCVHCLDVLQPQEATAPNGGRPVVVLVHGGAWVGGMKDGSGGDGNGILMDLWGAELATRGYVVVSINYTITDPTPLAGFLQCEWDPPQALGPPCPPQLATTVHAAQYDTQAAVRWLRNTVTAGGNPYRIRSSRIMVLGASAGAATALDALYRPDDPGTVGITTGDSSVSAAVGLAAFTNSTYQRKGAGPALLINYTNDVLGEFYGFDLYDAGRELVQRANEVGTTTELDSYCQRVDVNGDGSLDPLHLAGPPMPAYTQQVARATTWLYQRVIGATINKKPFPATWFGNTGSTNPLVAAPGQVLVEGTHKTLTGDFDGDGRTDIFFYSPGTGCDTVWFGRADGTFDDPREVTPENGIKPYADLNGDFVPLVADFDNDGVSDVLFVSTTGHGSEAWFGKPSRVFSTSVFDLPAGWQWFAGDFDGDHLTDVGIAINNGWAIAYGEGNLSFTWDLAHARPGAGTRMIADLNGDGHDDLLFIGSTVTVFYGGTHGGNAGFTSLDLGPPPTSAPPVAGDFDGDHRDDLLWHDAGGANATVWYGLASGVDPHTTGVPWPAALPSVGDFDGNGRSDVLWYDPAGSAAIWRGGADRVAQPFTTVTPTAIVDAGRVPVVGNFNGDSAGAGFERDDVYWSTG